MYKTRLLAFFSIVAFLITVVQWDSVTEVLAEANYTPNISVLLVDREAIRQIDGGADLAGSFIEILSALRDNQHFMFMSICSELETFGPYNPTDSNYLEIRQDIVNNLNDTRFSYGGNIGDALVAAKSVLNEQRAAVGSEVYLITGDTRGKDIKTLGIRLSPLVGTFTESGWRINGVSLPGSSPELHRFLETISYKSGGENFQLTGVDDLRQFTSERLSDDIPGYSRDLGSTDLISKEVMITPISVLPSTSRATVILLRDSYDGDINLIDPKGVDVSAGSFPNTSMIQTANVVIWHLKNPIPGDWKLNLKNGMGTVHILENVVSDYSLELVRMPPVPLGHPTTLMVNLEEGDGRVVLDGVRLYASIITPTGTRLVAEMKDDGTNGDTVSNDGRYAMILSPLRTSGEYLVDLELEWDGFNHRLSSLTSFEAIPYPELLMELFDGVDIQPGERTEIASISVLVDGEPYLVDPGQVTATVNSIAGNTAKVEIVPNRTGDGPEFEYDVFLTVYDYGSYTISHSLSTEYAGRVFGVTSELVRILSKRIPSGVLIHEGVRLHRPPRLSQSVEPVNTDEDLSNAVETLLVSVEPIDSETMLSGWVLGSIFVVIAIVVVASMAHFVTRRRPYGYLYCGDDRLINFSEIKNNPILSLFKRGSISGRDLGIPALNGLVFSFTSGKISLRNRNNNVSVRVNNQPLVKRVAIGNHTWIGVSGKLYTFLTGPPPPPSPDPINSS